jgi:hypothetical protein
MAIAVKDLSQWLRHARADQDSVQTRNQGNRSLRRRLRPWRADQSHATSPSEMLLTAAVLMIPLPRDSLIPASLQRR